MGTAQWRCRLTMGVMSVVLLALGLVGAAAQEDEFVDLSMIELEAHEEAYKPSFSVCKYLLEETKERLGDGDRSWPHVAHHIAHVRSTLPERVRTDCDHFIKHNKEDIMTNFLQLGMETAKDVRLEEHAPEPKQKKKIPSVWAMMEEQSLAQAQAQATAQQSASDGESSGSGTGAGVATDATTGGGASASESAAQYWEEKGQYCGACLTMTKKLSKWMQMACTQSVVVDRLMRMCGTMPPELADMCKSQKLWIAEYIIQKIAEQFPLPNHCAYIGLCEKTAVIMSLQNPLVRADTQDVLLEEMENADKTKKVWDSSSLQEGEQVLSKAYKTPTSVPEITFNLDQGSVAYDAVSKAQGVGLPSFYIDGTDAPKMADPLQSLLELDSKSVPASLIPTVAPMETANDELSRYTISVLETASQVRSRTPIFGGFDTTGDKQMDPEVQLHAQNQDDVNVPIMHNTLKNNEHAHTIGNVDNKDFFMLKEAIPDDTGNYPNLKTSIPTAYLEGCGACQFTMGAMYEFLSNARTVRALLPAIKKSCSSCNSAEEITKCEALVENHGVAFYQDVLREASPFKWCPRLELCEINYFIPSPHVLPDTYLSIKHNYDPDNIEF